MATQSKYDWTDEKVIKRLLACDTAEKMLKQFPKAALQTLRNQKNELAKRHPELMPVIKVDEPVDADDTEPSPEVKELQRANDRLSRELYKTKHKQQSYLDTLWEAVTEAINGQVIKPVRRPQIVPRLDRTPEVAVALLSDTQTGKLTPTYNSDVARERVERYAEKIIKLARIQEKDHPVRKCVVAMLGDMVEGVDIFPGQQWLIDSTLYRQLLDTTPTMIVHFIRTLLTYFDEVEAVCVDGNHGRIGRKGQFGPEDNADRMVYRLVEMMLRDEPRFKLTMTDPKGERNWYHIMQLGNYKALLIHGDQIRGHSGFPWYGLGKKVQGWGSGGLGRHDSDFLDVFMGHYHQAACVPLNHRAVWANGTTESSNTFAAENLAAQSEPMQWLLFVDPDKGRVTASYRVELS